MFIRSTHARKRLSWALTIVLGLPFVATAQNNPAGLTDSRLAYFSPARAFSLSADGKAAQTKLSALEAQKAKEIEARNNDLQGRRAAFEGTSAALNDATRRLREQELQRFEVDVQRFIQDAQEALGVAQREVENAFIAKLRPAIADVAKQKNLLIVFNEDVGLIAWADPLLDITPDVVRRIEQQ